MIFNVNTDGLQGIVDGIQDQVRFVLGVILGLAGLVSLIYSLIILFKVRTTGDPEKRKKHLIALLWLWGAIAGIGVVWGLSEIIIVGINSFIGV